MIFNHRTTAIALAGLAFAFSQAAGALATQCLNCPASKMYDIARSKGPGTVTVWNPANGEAHRFTSYCGQPNVVDPSNTRAVRPLQQKSGPPAGRAVSGCPVMTTEEYPLEQARLDTASALSTIWNYSGGLYVRNLRVSLKGQAFPAYQPRRPSAHDFLIDMAMQSQLADLASSPESLVPDSLPVHVHTAIQYVSTHIDMTPFTKGVPMLITLMFDDGSYVRYETVLGRRATYVSGSGNDSGDHALPDPNFGNNFYPGRWYFAPAQRASKEAFKAYLLSLGVPVTAGTGRKAGIVACTYNAPRRSTACVDYQ